jgi:transposase-like protein
MPWKEICTVELRQQLVRLVLGRTVSVTEMARCMGVSRKTAHKWLRRFSAGGEPALLDRSRAPRQPANRLDDAVVCRILSLRCQQPTWGAGKLRDRLLRDGLVNVPC